METELSKQFTKAYLADDFEKLGYEHLSEAIDNLPDGYVVFTRSDAVEIYTSFDDFKRHNKGLLAKDEWIALKAGSIDLDELNIQIVT